MFQEKGQDKTTEELNGVNNLPDKQFKAMIVKVLKELLRTRDEQSEKFCLILGDAWAVDQQGK